MLWISCELAKQGLNLVTFNGQPKYFYVMATSGYSETALIKKLGIKPNLRLLFIHEPPDYIKLLEVNISNQIAAKNEIPDFIHLFVKGNQEFEHEMRKLKPVINKNQSLVLWVSWYKKSAGIETDVTENTIRNFALKNGLVDVKVCAVSEIWSGLKLVVPLNLRKNH